MFSHRRQTTSLKELKLVILSSHGWTWRLNKGRRMLMTLLHIMKVARRATTYEVVIILFNRCNYPSSKINHLWWQRTLSCQTLEIRVKVKSVKMFSIRPRNLMNQAKTPKRKIEVRSALQEIGRVILSLKIRKAQSDFGAT